MRLFLFLLLSYQSFAAVTSIYSKTACASGCDFTTAQAAVNNVYAEMAADCDHSGVVYLAAGENFDELVDLATNKTCEYPFELKTSRYRELPNRRFNPATDSSLVPTIRIQSTGFGIWMGCAMPGASGSLGLACTAHTPKNITVRGVHILAYNGAINNYVGVVMGTSSVITSGFVLAEKWQYISSNNVLDQVWISGSPGIDLVRGVQADGIGHRITRSYFDDIVWFSDTQAIATIASKDLQIEDNYMSVSGESILVGGASVGGSSDPGIVGERNDIYLRGNFSWKNPKLYIRTGTTDPTGSCLENGYFKNTVSLAWFVCHTSWVSSTAPAWVNGEVSQKNCFELKDGDGIFIGNHCKGGWEDGQQGQSFQIGNFNGDNDTVPTIKIVAHYGEGNGGFVLSNSLDQTNSCPLCKAWKMTAFDNLVVNMWPPGSGSHVTMPMVHLLSTRDVDFRNNTLQFGQTPTSAMRFAEYRDVSSTNKNTGFSYWGANAIGLVSNFARMDSIVPGICQSQGQVKSANDFVDISHLGAIVPWAGATTGASCNANFGPPMYDIFATPNLGLLNSIIQPATESALWRTVGSDWRINLSLAAGLNSAPNGRDIGANIPFVLAMKAHVEDGAVKYQPQFWIQSVEKVGTGLAVNYLGPDNVISCTAVISATENFSSTTASDSNTRTGISGRAVFNTAAIGSWVRVTCGDFTMDDRLRS